MAFKSRFLSSKSLPDLGDRFEGVFRSGDRLKVRIGGLVRYAKAGLSRLLTHFKNNTDFVIITPYRLPKEGETPEETKRINEKNFQDFPRQFRALLGSAKIGAFELYGHWSERRDGQIVDTVERSWFFINGDPSRVSPEDFRSAAAQLADRYDQTAFIVKIHGECTLETPTGDVWNTLTTDGAIEKAYEKMMRAKYEFESGATNEDGSPKRQGWGYSEITRLRNKHDENGNPTREEASRFFLDDAPAKPKQEEQEQEVENEELEPKQSSLKVQAFQSFVAVPMSISDMKYFAYRGVKHPGWKW